jgi:hypothetical protein
LVGEYLALLVSDGLFIDRKRSFRMISALKFCDFLRPTDAN